jgi:hypothetical protein
MNVMVTSLLSIWTDIIANTIDTGETILCYFGLYESYIHHKIGFFSVRQPSLRSNYCKMSMKNASTSLRSRRLFFHLVYCGLHELRRKFVLMEQPECLSAFFQVI